MFALLKNIGIGFCISFIGSIPLGYLNIVGWQLYQGENLNPVLYYLFGVVLIEIIVIYTTLLLASKLILKSKWKQLISLFTIFFLLGLAFVFYKNGQTNHENQVIPYANVLKAPLLVGLFLSSLNVAQIPFWFSWNLYVLNEGYLENSTKKYPFYILGAAVGTYSGMLTIIIGLHQAIAYSQKSFDFQQYIWFLFLALAVFQVVIMLKEYFKNRRNLH
jgi:hypothetical protein